MALVERWDIGGIPCFQAADSGSRHGGKPRTTLIFRVGSHDETGATRGLTQLVNTLIHASLPDEIREHVTVVTGSTFSRFHIDSPDDRAAACLLGVAKAVESPNWNLLEECKDLLAPEDLDEGLGAQSFIWQWRYGCVGPGASMASPIGMRFATELSVLRWLDRWYTRANVAIASTHELILPVLAMRDGVARDLLLTESLCGDAPARIAFGESNTVAFQVATPLTVGASLAMALVSERLDRVLVRRGRLTYRLASGYSPIDSSAATFTAAFSASDNVIDKAIQTVFGVLPLDGELQFGPEEFEDAHMELIEQLAAPKPGWVDAMDSAYEHLYLGYTSYERQLSEAHSLTREECGAIAQNAIQTMLLAVPSVVAGLDHIPFVEDPSVRAPTEARSLHSKSRFGRLPRAPRVELGSNALIVSEYGESNSMTFEDCVGVVDDGTSMQLLSRHWKTLAVTPALVVGGEQITKALKASVPQELWVDAPSSYVDVRNVRTARDVVRWAMSARSWIFTLLAVLLTVTAVVAVVSVALR